MSDMLTQANRYFCQAREFAIGGHTKMILANLVGPTSYVTGGVRLDPQSIGAGTKGKIANAGSVMSDSGTYFVRGKFVSLTSYLIMWFTTADGLEVANATDLDAETLTGIPIIFIP